MTDSRPAIHAPRPAPSGTELAETHAAPAMPRPVLRAWAALLAALDAHPPLDVAVALGDAITVLLDTDSCYAVPTPAAVRAKVHGAVDAPLPMSSWPTQATAALRHLTSAIDEASTVHDLARYGAAAAQVRRLLDQREATTTPAVGAP